MIEAGQERLLVLRAAGAARVGINVRGPGNGDAAYRLAPLPVPEGTWIAVAVGTAAQPPLVLIPRTGERLDQVHRLLPDRTSRSEDPGGAAAAAAWRWFADAKGQIEAWESAVLVKARGPEAVRVFRKELVVPEVSEDSRGP